MRLNEHTHRHTRPITRSTTSIGPVVNNDLCSELWKPIHFLESRGHILEMMHHKKWQYIKPFNNTSENGILEKSIPVFLNTMNL